MKPLQQTDQAVLHRIFFPSENAESTDGVFAFGKKKPPPGFHSQQFYFVKNPGGTIRWLQPTGCGKPIFLQLYNGQGWRGRLFRTVFRAAFALGLKRFVVDGTVSVFYQKNELFGGLLPQNMGCDFAIFTGTEGENRKAVFALRDEDGKDWFFKLPLTDQSQLLVETELMALRELSLFSFEKTAVPVAVKKGNGVLVSSVRPARIVDGAFLQNAHFQSLKELASQTAARLPLRNLPVWAEISDDMAALSNLPGDTLLPQATTKKLHGQLLQLQASFDEDRLLPTAIAHGDFTPWNMYLSKEKLHLYDWELSARLPLLYDAFHFIFQSGVLVERAIFSEIFERVEALKSEPTIREIWGGDAGLFDELYRFYLLRNVSYYLARYVRQRPLHAQAFWLVEAWGEAVGRGVENVPAEASAF